MDFFQIFQFFIVQEQFSKTFPKLKNKQKTPNKTKQENNNKKPFDLTPHPKHNPERRKKHQNKTTENNSLLKVRQSGWAQLLGKDPFSLAQLHPVLREGCLLIQCPQGSQALHVWKAAQGCLCLSSEGRSPEGCVGF
jgi:hypothetical protein